MVVYGSLLFGGRPYICKRWALGVAGWRFSTCVLIRRSRADAFLIGCPVVVGVDGVVVEASTYLLGDMELDEARTEGRIGRRTLEVDRGVPGVETLLERGRVVLGVRDRRLPLRLLHCESVSARKAA